jgi:hypothetical protein
MSKAQKNVTKLRDYVSVKDYGAVGDGSTDDSAAINAAMAANKCVYFPPATYKVNSPLIINNGQKIVGYSRTASILSSGVIGDSLFKTTASSVAFVYMADLQLIGNNLTGATGNGHALNLVDPAITSGAWSPSQSVFERLYIRQFRGEQSRDNGTSNKVNACAIIDVDGLGNVFKDINIENCGHGFFMKTTQNNRIINPLITGCDVWGILSYDNENLIVYDGDVNTCGDDTITDATGYIETGLYSGNVLSARDDDFLLIGMKVKRSPGIAQVHLFLTIATITGGWYRADHDINKGYIGVLVTNPIDVTIQDVTFTPTSGSLHYAANKVTHIKETVASTHNVAAFRVLNNKFRTQSLQNVAACVHMYGTITATRMEAFQIVGNAFGTPQAVLSATTYDTDVLMERGSFANGVITGNTHYDAADATGVFQRVVKTAHYQLTNGFYRSNVFAANTLTLGTVGYSPLTFSGFNPYVETVTLNKTLTQNEANRVYLYPSTATGVVNITVPANSAVPYPIGAKLKFINSSSYVVTIIVTTDSFYLAGVGSAGTRAIAAGGELEMTKIAATAWHGNGTSVT